MIAPPDGVLRMRESGARQRERTLTALERARADLASARHAVDELEDEARRAGCWPSSKGAKLPEGAKEANGEAGPLRD